MKKTLLIISLSFFSRLMYSQGFTQSAEGKSTLLFKGTGIGLDIMEADLSFGINNLTGKVLSDTSVRPIYGINFNELSKKEFNWKKETTSLGQTITEEKKIIAYKGKFSEVEYNELNADILYNIRFGDSLKYNLLLNPYVRANLLSRDITVK